MSFKDKIRKKSHLDHRATLQAKHNEKIKYFKEKDILIQDKKDQLKMLEENLHAFDGILNKCLTEEQLKDKLEIKDIIREFKEELNQETKENEKISYLLDTGSILFSYYNQLNENKPKPKKKKNGNSQTNKKTIIDFFKDKNNNPNVENSELIIKHKNIHNFLNKSSLSKERMYETYSLKVGDKQLSIDQYEDKSIELCLNCNVERKLFMSDGKMICPKCGDEKFILIDSDKPSYKEPPRELSYFAYKRINHLNEWLAQFQAKESTDIPNEVYDKILSELKKERITNIILLTSEKLREILKKLKLNKYYEHIPHIKNRLNGIPPPTITRETEEELRRMFKEIQLPFHKFCPKDRKNFLSYSYVLHKFMQLLEMDEFLSCFMLLKSREKLHQQDKIWKNICGYLKWQFIPSV